MLAILAQIAARHDQDGIDVHFLNNSKVYRGLKVCISTSLFMWRTHLFLQNTSEVAQIFQSVKPRSGTPTATKLDKILGEYFGQLESAYSQKKRWFRRQKPVKPLNLIVITDGRPFPASQYFAK